MIQNSKNMMIAGVLVAVCAVVGGAAWLHRSEQAAPAPAIAPIADVSVQPSGVHDSDGYYPSTERPVYVREGSVAAAPLPERRVYEEREVYSDGRTRHHGRSKEHSVEIVAGTAAAGAAIGAIAGGGKGAAIGAISGGGAGFAYDRMTHNH